MDQKLLEALMLIFIEIGRFPMNIEEIMDRFANKSTELITLSILQILEKESFRETSNLVQIHSKVISS